MLSIDTWINLLSSLSAVLAAVATLIMVFEIKKQRIASYLPDLTLLNVNLKGSGSENIPANWINADNDSQNDEGFTVPLLNIGLGAAKEIYLTWRFPVKAMTAKINTLIKQQEKKFNFDENWHEENNIYIDYILPSAISTEPVPIRLPKTYINIVSMLIYLSGKDVEVKSIKLVLRYLDIGGIKRKRTLKIKFILSGYEPSEKKFDAWLQAVKIHRH